MELRHYIGILRRSWQLLVGLPILVGVITLALGLLLPPTYEITTQMLVTQGTIASSSPPLALPNYENYHSWISSEYIDDDLPQLVQTRRFASDVADWVQANHGITLDPNDITSQFSAERQHRMVSLTTVDRRKDVAKYLAEAGVAVLQQNGLGYWEREETASLNVSEVDMPPEAKRVQGLGRLALDTLLRSMLALILAVGLAFLRYYMDRSLHTRAQVEALGIGPAAIIPRTSTITSRSKSSTTLMTLRDPHSAGAEGYRALRTRLQFGTGAPPRTLLVTSATADEDRADVVANLAVTFAQAGQRVIVVDADLRRPMLHTLFDVSNDTGVSTALVQDRMRLPLQSTKIAGLSVMAAGPANERSADMLASSRMDTLIEKLAQEANVVLFNTPPIGLLTDAAVLATKVDGALVVLRAGKTNADHARDAVRLLEQVNARVLGAIFTDAPVEHTNY